jgi:hypothetical protein
VRSLHYLFDFYADRAQRSGRSGEPQPLVTAYHVRPPVLRQVLAELARRADEQPEHALALCEALWNEPYLEFRLLAAAFLGQIPTRPPEEVQRRLQIWLVSKPEVRLSQALLDQGLRRMRLENPEAAIALAAGWLEAGNDVYQQQLGLRALLPMINDLRFENLPVFFRLIVPLTRTAPTALRPDLLDVLESLARRSPPETAFFLRQTLDTPNSPDTPWLIRQCLRAFPDELQASLRETVRGLGHSNGRGNGRTNGRSNGRSSW